MNFTLYTYFNRNLPEMLVLMWGMSLALSSSTWTKVLSEGVLSESHFVLIELFSSQIPSDRQQNPSVPWIRFRNMPFDFLPSWFLSVWSSIISHLFLILSANNSVFWSFLPMLWFLIVSIISFLHWDFIAGFFFFSFFFWFCHFSPANLLLNC